MNVPTYILLALTASCMLVGSVGLFWLRKWSVPVLGSILVISLTAALWTMYSGTDGFFFQDAMDQVINFAISALVFFYAQHLANEGILK